MTESIFIVDVCSIVNTKHVRYSKLNTLYMLCVTPTQKLLCLHVFRQAGPSQRVDCLAPKWEIALSVFLKNVATRYLIGSRTKVSQPFQPVYLLAAIACV